MTNREKFEEIFGFAPCLTPSVCPREIACVQNCRECSFGANWWDKEFDPYFKITNEEKTNREKFEEIFKATFGFIAEYDDFIPCPSGFKCEGIECKDCPFNYLWWDKKYKPCFKLREG